MTGLSRSIVAIIGISSQLGPALVTALEDNNLDVVGLSRSPTTTARCPVHIFRDGASLPIPPLPPISALISIAPLPAIVEVARLANLIGVRRVIAFGSTGVFSKTASTADVERQFVRDQLAAEQAFASLAVANGFHWTLFRPTMIYGAGTDQNVTFIRSMIRRFRAFPIPLGAKGLRQPVHVEDLADACVKVLNNPATFNRAYNLGGGEVIEYAEMVRRICRADGLPARLISIPRTLYRWIVRAARRMPGLAYLNETMVDRMFTDLTTDHSDAERDFGYAPRKFQPPGRVSANL